jgi:DNA-binding NarL/FixJ family response regulator
VLVVAPPSRFRDSLQAIVRALLALNHSRVVQATDASSVLGLPIDRAPALVLLDLAMPANDPTALLKSIKGQWSGTRCIAVVKDATDGHAAMHNGADAVLTRGYTFGALAEALSVTLDGAGAGSD